MSVQNRTLEVKPKKYTCEIRWCIQITADTKRKAENRRKSTREDCGKIEETADFSYTVRHKIEIKKKKIQKTKPQYCCS
jgi:hypothetical protein